jgi:hypothetical protein
LTAIGLTTQFGAKKVFTDGITISISSGSNPACAGSSVNFSSGFTQSTGPGGTYIWRKGGTPIPGATNSSFSLSGVSSTDAAIYELQYTVSGTTITSNQINLTVNSTPTTPAISTSTITTFCQGGSVTLTSSSASGNQWYRNATLITAATGQIYNATISGDYTVIVTTATCPSPATAATTVTVNPVIATNTLSATQTICTGTAPAALTGSTPTGGNGTFAYLWESSTTSATTVFTPINGATSADYTPRVLTANTWYRRTVTSGGCANTSTAVAITVSPVIASNTISAAQAICTGTASAPLTGTTPTGGNGTFTYLWESSTDGSTFTTAAGSNNAAGYTVGPLTQTTFYGRTVTSGGCSHTSAAIQIIVSPVIAANTITADQTICTGTTPASLSGSTPTGGNGTYAYQWQIGTTGISGTFTNINNATTDIYAPAALTTTTAYRRVVTSGGCSSTSNAVLITVNPIIASNTITAAQTICTNTTAAALTGSAPSSGAGTGTYTFLWESSTDGTTFTAAATGAGPNNTQNYAPGPLTQTTLFRRTVTSGGCTSISPAIQITVSPLISANTITTDQSICTNTTPASLAGSTPTGGSGTYGYQWQSSTSANGTFSNIAGATAANYAPGSLTTTTFYRRVVTSGGCTDNSAAVQITVNPVIAGNTVSAAQAICTNTTPTALTGSTPTGGNGTYVYQWESSTTSAIPGLTPIAGATSADFAPGALTATTWYRRTVTSGGCASTSTAVQITVNPIIASNTISAAQAICTGTAPVALTGTTPTGWQRNFHILMGKQP